MSIRELIYERSVKKTETIKKSEKEKDKVNIFDFLRQINEKTKKYKYDKKKAPAFLLSLWLSHEKNLIDIVHKVLPLSFYISEELIYKYYFDKIPKKRRFIKYIKKEDTQLEHEKNIEDIMEKYNVSKKEALMINKHIERLKK